MKQEIRDYCRNQGFNLVGFLNRKDCQFGSWITPWLDKKYHAEMQWMKNHRKIRENPCQIEPWVKSFVSAAITYYTDPPPFWERRNPISSYAWGEDYHVVLRRKLNAVIGQIEMLEPSFKGRTFVDTAPIPEKIIAQQCGLGWIGRNSMLINRRYGSYLFLGEIATNLELGSDTPAKNYCGACRRCIDDCPTGAIKEDGIIDANRCISYLTIEKRGPFTAEQERLIDYQVFGCDICQQVCPWNKRIPESEHAEFKCFDRWKQKDLSDPDWLTPQQFEELKIKSPVKRTKYQGFKRNIEAVFKA